MMHADLPIHPSRQYRGASWRDSAPSVGAGHARDSAVQSQRIMAPIRVSHPPGASTGNDVSAFAGS